MNGIPEVQMSGDVQSVSPIIGIEKKCTKCGEIKSLDDFYYAKAKKDKRASWCKVCERKLMSLWGKNNKERRRVISQKWRDNNREKQRECVRRAGKRKRSKLQFRLKNNMSLNIWQSLQNNKHGNYWERLVGYGIDDLKEHLEKQFKDGMSWENYGEWAIDHIIPKSAFNFEKPEDEDFKRCWNLKNLQPMWARENSIKGKKIPKPFQPTMIFK